MSPVKLIRLAVFDRLSRGVLSFRADVAVAFEPLTAGTPHTSVKPTA